MSFVRYYFARSGRQGVIIDERVNGGGPGSRYCLRVMIVNEVAGSGGDAISYYFRFHNLGPLVGTRTWGGLVGILGFPLLMDGGSVTAPNFAFRNTSGAFDVETEVLRQTSKSGTIRRRCGRGMIRSWSAP